MPAALAWCGSCEGSSCCCISCIKLTCCNDDCGWMFRAGLRASALPGRHHQVWQHQETQASGAPFMSWRFCCVQVGTGAMAPPGAAREERGAAQSPMSVLLVDSLPATPTQHSPVFLLTFLPAAHTQHSQRIVLCSQHNLALSAHLLVVSSCLATTGKSGPPHISKSRPLHPQQEPPGAPEKLTPRSPSGAGPRLDHVYCCPASISPLFIVGGISGNRNPMQVQAPHWAVNALGSERTGQRM